MLSPLQLREVFHLEFLRWFGRKVKPQFYCLKGGTNLRFFFHSFRYSEDMDIDIYGVRVDSLKDLVINILQASDLQDSLKPFGIQRVIPPDIIKAKQTETTQRFKVHLITFSGEDLFTKIEFSRRGLKKGIVVQPILDSIVRAYKLAPLLVAHYDFLSTVAQKIEAITSRAVIQARDIFDLFILSSQYADKEIKENGELFKKSRLMRAYENIFEVSFEQFRDTVISYLSPEDQSTYNSLSSWDEVKLKAGSFIEELKKKYA